MDSINDVGYEDYAMTELEANELLQSLLRNLHNTVQTLGFVSSNKAYETTTGMIEGFVKDMRSKGYTIREEKDVLLAVKREGMHDGGRAMDTGELDGKEKAKKTDDEEEEEVMKAVERIMGKLKL